MFNIICMQTLESMSRLMRSSPGLKLTKSLWTSYRSMPASSRSTSLRRETPSRSAANSLKSTPMPKLLNLQRHPQQSQRLQQPPQPPQLRLQQPQQRPRSQPQLPLLRLHHSRQPHSPQVRKLQRKPRLRSQVRGWRPGFA